MRRLLVIPAVLLLLLAAAMVMSGSATEKRADFTFVNRGDVKTLDLSKMSYLQDIRLAYALWEGLYTLDPVTLEPVAGCAEPIEVSADQKTYTFHIRPDARWTNGDPLMASDFIFGWKRMLDEQGEYAELLQYIEGAKEYQDASAANLHPDFRKVGVETDANDPRFLRVKLRHPTTFFPSLCAFPCYFPSHAKSMFVTDEKTGASAVRRDYTRPPYLVTNGPYRFDQWQFKRKLRLVASEYYWNQKSVKSKVIDMVVIEDQQNALAAFEAGSVDWLSDVTGVYGAELRKQGRPDLHVFPGFGTYYYSFNCQDKLPDGSDNPLRDVKVRRALSMAVYKPFIVDNISRLGQPVATTYIPRGVFKGYESPAGLPFDVEAARKLLAEAGYPNGRAFPVLKINFNTDDIHKDIAEYMQRQWKENLNISVELDGKELKTYGEQLHQKQYSISRASWIGDYNDPSTFTDKYRPESGGNDAGWKNDAFEALCKKAETETDNSVRLKLFHDAEEILLGEAPILPLYYYVDAYMFRENVKGIALNPRDMIMLHAAEVQHRP
jgi:oligopeptide transport system substrate-binding protein